MGIMEGSEKIRLAFHLCGPMFVLFYLIPEQAGASPEASSQRYLGQSSLWWRRCA
jgi:hypothetical protein